jgi:hypothetical protein
LLRTSSVYIWILKWCCCAAWLIIETVFFIRKEHGVPNTVHCWFRMCRCCCRWVHTQGGGQTLLLRCSCVLARNSKAGMMCWHYVTTWPAPGESDACWKKQYITLHDVTCFTQPGVGNLIQAPTRGS